MKASDTTASVESDLPVYKLAVLIDADNTQAAFVEPLLAKAAQLGVVIIKRIYGEFTDNRLSKWKQCLNRNAICAVHQFAHTPGKNATDIRLIIDAMDLLYKGHVQGFCLVSSDSDFTMLVHRIREEGRLVYGFGLHTAPESFRNACDRFIFLEDLEPCVEIDSIELAETLRKPPNADGGATGGKTTSAKRGRNRVEIHVDFLKRAIRECGATQNKEGWVPLALVGQYIKRLNPDISPKVKPRPPFIGLTYCKQ